MILSAAAVTLVHRASSRRRRACARALSAKAFGAVVLLASVAGCSLWQGRLDPEFEKKLEARLRNIDLARLEVNSSSRPMTVDEGLVQMKRMDPTTQPAPSSMELSIEDVRRHVLHNNLDLSIYLLEPEIARTRISEEEARFDAAITVGAKYKKQDLPELDGSVVQLSEKNTTLGKALKAFEKGFSSGPATTGDKGGKSGELKSGNGLIDGSTVKLTEIAQQKESFDTDIGLLVPLPTGATLRLGQYFDQDNKLAPFTSNQSMAATRFSLSQPLLRNAGVEVNTAAIRIARLGERSSVARTKLVAIRLLAAAEKAYWKLYGAREMLEIRRRLIDLAEKNLEIVQKRTAEGLIPAIEVIRAEVGVAQQLESLIIAETTERIAERDLKRILNMEGVGIDSSTRLLSGTPPRLLRYELNAEALVREAMSKRMEMLELELAVAADDLRIEFARNQTLPLITLDFEYGLLDRGGSFGTAWQNAWDFDKGEFGVGIRGEIPVTNELRKSQLRRAVLTRTQRLATRSARELSIRQEVHDALDVLNQNWQRILAARQTVIAAGVNYDAERKQFDEGTRTMREVFEALAQLGDAQSREVSAIVAYQVALIDLAFATGTLLGYAKVDVLDARFD